MEYQGRRSRRGRRSSFNTLNHSFSPPPRQNNWSFLNWSLYNLLIMGSMIGAVYILLEFHCDSCKAKGNIAAITMNIEEISRNLAVIKDNYNGLEANIVQFSKELPKIQGQLEVLEAIANTVEQSQFGYDPRISHFCLPNVDVSLKCAGDMKNKNCTRTPLPRSPRPIKT